MVREMENLESPRDQALKASSLQDWPKTYFKASLRKILPTPGATSLQSHTRCKEIQDFLPTTQVRKMVT